MDTDLTTTKKVALVDAMAEVQSMKKLDAIKTCLELAVYFASTVTRKYQTHDEI